MTEELTLKDIVEQCATEFFLENMLHVYHEDGREYGYVNVATSIAERFVRRMEEPNAT